MRDRLILFGCYALLPFMLLLGAIVGFDEEELL